MASVSVSGSGNPGEGVGTGPVPPASSRQDAARFLAAESAHDSSRPPSAQPPRRQGSVLNYSVSDKATQNTVRVELDDKDLPDSVHMPSTTFRLRLAGKGAIKVNQMDLCVAMVSQGILTLEEWDNYVLFYRLADAPFERFIHLTPETGIQLRHGASFTFQPATSDDPTAHIECNIEDLSVQETTLFMNFVPVTFVESNVREVLKKAKLEVLNLRRDSKEADKWIVNVRNSKKEVPHYIRLNKLSTKDDGMSTSILVTVPGRLTECSVPGCRSTSHRANKCPIIERNKEKGPSQQLNQRQTYAGATKGWKNKARAVHLLEKEKTQQKVSDYEWQTVQSRSSTQQPGIRIDVATANRYALLEDANERDACEKIIVDELNEEEPEPVRCSTPKSPVKRKHLQREAKRMAALVNTVLLAQQEEQRQKKKNEKKPAKSAGKADGGKTGQRRVLREKIRERRKRKRINLQSSGEPHQGENESDGTEWENVSLLDRPNPSMVIPTPDPEVVPESQPDLTSDATRGPGPGGSGETAGGHGDLTGQLINVQNSIFVHHDSSQSNTL